MITKKIMSTKDEQIKKWLYQSMMTAIIGDEIPEYPEGFPETTVKLTLLIIGGYGSVTSFSVPVTALKYIEEFGKDNITTMNMIDVVVGQELFFDSGDVGHDDYEIKKQRIDNPRFKKSTKKFLKKTKYPSKKGQRNSNHYYTSRKQMKHNCNKR